MRLFKFSHNWNNKLFCNQFSTIRLRNDTLNVIDDIVECKLKDDSSFRAEIKYIKHFKYTSLTDGMTRLDMDMPLKKAKTVLERMYRHKVSDINNQVFSFIVLRKII